MFKKVKVFLVVVIFILIGVTTANAQELAQWDAFLSFELGLNFGVLLDTSEINPADPVFNWGFKSNVFDWKEKDESSLYLSLYYTIYEGDPDTGAGYMGAWMWLDFEVGNVGHDAYIPAAFFVLDPFGIGQNKIGYTEIFSYVYTQWHNQIENYMTFGIIYFFFSTYLQQLWLDVWVMDYQNDGVYEDATGLNFKPLQSPTTWGQTEETGKSEVGIGITDLDLKPITINGSFSFTLMRTMYNRMDDNINPAGGRNLWGGWYYGVTDDEQPGYEGFYTWDFYLSINLDLIDIGYISLWGDLEFNKLTADTGRAVIKGTGNFKLDFDKLLDEKMRVAFGAYYEFFQRNAITIHGETQTLNIAELPFRNIRLELIFDWHYIIDAGIKIKPNVKVVFDLANILNGYNMPTPGTLTDDPILAYLITVGVDLGLGGNGILELPIFLRFTNVPMITVKKWTEKPWNYRLTYGEGRTPDGVGEAPDNFLRILWGFGFKCKF